tara:strand:- start:28 stop:423 length:396 start_codon:yes stop_codon:yes gene_type:complete
MASTLKINTLTGVTTAGSIAVTGEGNSTTTNLQQGLAKVWANIDGASTVHIDDSFNTSGITDNATGDYSISLTNDMSSTDYAPTASTEQFTIMIFASSTKTSGQCRLDVENISGSNTDDGEVNLVIHGDLA